MAFEEILTFHRQGGFTLKNLDSDRTKKSWLIRQESLGGPKLLERNPKKSVHTSEDDKSSDDESGDEDDAPSKAVTSPTPSFRSDRRIIRLLIARHYADTLERAYLKDKDQKVEE